MFYNSQKGYGLKDLFRNITRPFKPVLKPVLKEAKAIGAELQPFAFKHKPQTF